MTAQKDCHQALSKGDCDLQQAAINAEVEAAAAAVEAELDAQEWNMQEIERIQEEQASACRRFVTSVTYLRSLNDQRIASSAPGVCVSMPCNVWQCSCKLCHSANSASAICGKT
jgi:hypothetical protein